jgi:hypothetical protein
LTVKYKDAFKTQQLLTALPIDVVLRETIQVVTLLPVSGTYPEFVKSRFTAWVRE